MKRITAVLAAAGCVAVLIIFWALIARSLQMFFGFRNGDGNGSHYLFFSGSGSDLAYLSIAWGAYIYYRKNNCKRAWCPLIGQHPFTDPEDGISRLLCWVHHPDVLHRALKPEVIEKIQHKRGFYLGNKPGKG